MTIRIRNHFRALVYFLINIVSFSFVIWFVNFDPLAMLIFSSALLLILLPTLFLHLEYFFTNRNQTIELSKNGIVIKYQTGEVVQVASADLKKILIYQSANMLKNGIPILPTEYYFYVRILTNNARPDIIITSLMMSASLSEVDIFSALPREIKRPLFASIKYPLVVPEPTWLLKG